MLRSGPEVRKSPIRGIVARNWPHLLAKLPPEDEREWAMCRPHPLGQRRRVKCDSSQLNLTSRSPLLAIAAGASSMRGGSERYMDGQDRMTPDQYSALQRLADVPRGIAKTLMLAHGFTHELIAGLVLAGLATVVTDTARIGEQTIEVELVMITAAGRRAIEAEQTSGRKSPEGERLIFG